MKRKQGGFLFSCSNAMKFTQLFDKGKLNFKFGEQRPIQGREPRIRASLDIFLYLFGTFLMKVKACKKIIRYTSLVNILNIDTRIKFRPTLLH